MSQFCFRAIVREALKIDKKSSLSFKEEGKGEAQWSEMKRY